MIVSAVLAPVKKVKKITMPAMYMREKGKELGETFKHFAAVAERSQIYAPKDYADILEHLLNDWDIENLKGLGDKAEAAQEYLCSLPERYRKVAERFAGRTVRDENVRKDRRGRKPPRQGVQTFLLEMS